MPKVTKTSDGSTFTSHWIASPNKYMEPEPAAAFAGTFGLELDREGIISPCGECHGGKLSRMKTKAEGKQDDIYADALIVQAALVDSLAAIKAAKDGGGDPVQIAAAAVDHRAAHVRWENLVVSENSMGFHNPSEVGDELGVALIYAQSAKQKAEDALGACVITEDPEVSCFDSLDNDCNLDIDCADANCDGAMGDATSCGLGQCAGNTGQLMCSGGTEVDTCDPFAGASPEVCTGGLDEDCDGLTDGDDTADCPTGACEDITNKGDCNMNPNCEWVGKGAAGMCVDYTPPTCSDYTKKKQCENAGCTWDGTTCIDS
jgi:hypothetical protein